MDPFLEMVVLWNRLLMSMGDGCPSRLGYELLYVASTKAYTEPEGHHLKKNEIATECVFSVDPSISCSKL